MLNKKDLLDGFSKTNVKKGETIVCNASPSIGIPAAINPKIGALKFSTLSKLTSLSPSSIDLTFPAFLLIKPLASSDCKCS